MGNEFQSFKYEYYNLNSNFINKSEDIRLLYSKNVPKAPIVNKFYWIMYNDSNNLIVKKTEILNDSNDLFAGPFNTEDELNEFLYNIKTLNYEIKYED